MKADLLTHKEERRLEVQASLDAMKSQAERNRMGQFATPFPLALDILSYAKKLLPRGQQIRFLDPGFGTGVFYSALLQTFPAVQIAAATGYEIDPHYGRPACSFGPIQGLTCIYRILLKPRSLKKLSIW